MENCKQQTGVPVKKLFALPHSANENNININIPNQSCSNDEKRLNSFVVEGQPLKLSVETSTDWPTVLATFFVGVTGALVAFAVGYMAYRGQRYQIRAAKAQFRHDWQKEIKELIARFVSLIAVISYELQADSNYLTEKNSNKIYGDLIEVYVRIGIMLDRKQPYTKDMSRVLELLVNAVKTGRTDRLNDLSAELTTIANGVVEKTWIDINDDIEDRKRK